MAPHEDLLRRLCAIPGVEMTTARVLVAELGTDMTPFPDAAHAASWAGLCPGNSESAGKRFSGRTRKGDRYLRRILVQSAWAAARTRDCFLAALFHRVAHRRGLKKAAVAVAHRILTIVWSMIRNGSEYQERGGDRFDRLHPERTARKLLRRLERIGFEVALKRPLGRPKILKPPMPAGSCPKCWRWGIPDCIHLLKPPRKSQPISNSQSDSVGESQEFSKEPHPGGKAAGREYGNPRGTGGCCAMAGPLRRRTIPAESEA